MNYLKATLRSDSGSPDNSLSGCRSEAQAQEAAEGVRAPVAASCALIEVIDQGPRTTSCPGYPFRFRFIPPYNFS